MDIVNLIKNSTNILIIGHARPDGDCFGAGLTLLSVCEKFEKKAYFVCDSELPVTYSFLKGFEKVNQFEILDYDLLISVDCGDMSRLGRYKEYLKKTKITVNIDHHISNNGYAKINYLKPGMSSTCQIIYELLEQHNIIDKDIAELLFVGLSTDTGHFMHNTVDSAVFRVAAKLAEFGACPFEIAERLYKTRTINKTNLIARAIQSMRFFENNTICFITISAKDFLECNCKLTDTEGIVDYASSIAGIKVAACLAEQKERLYKVGLRSKGVNVANVAAYFGGGGHIRAAGCMLNGFYEDIIDKLRRAVTNEIDSTEEANR